MMVSTVMHLPNEFWTHTERLIGDDSSSEATSSSSVACLHQHCVCVCALDTVTVFTSSGLHSFSLSLFRCGLDLLEA